MALLIVLIIWLAVLVGLTVFVTNKKQLLPQRIFSIFLIVFALLAVAYYDVWLNLVYTGTIAWYHHILTLLFAICAGIGVAFFILSVPTIFMAMQRHKVEKKLIKEQHEKIPRPERKDKRKK